MEPQNKIESVAFMETVTDEMYESTPWRDTNFYDADNVLISNDDDFMPADEYFVPVDPATTTREMISEAIHNTIEMDFDDTVFNPYSPYEVKVEAYAHTQSDEPEYEPNGYDYDEGVSGSPRL